MTTPKRKKPNPNRCFFHPARVCTQNHSCQKQPHFTRVLKDGVVERFVWCNQAETVLALGCGKLGIPQAQLAQYR